MSSTTSLEYRNPRAIATTAWRWEPWSGIAFPVLFAASIAASGPPADSASDSTWIANYTGRANDARHLATGLLLVFASLSLASFLTALWRRIRAAAPGRSLSPMPLVAAASSSACIAAGGVVMATVAGGELIGTYPLPGADILRLSNDLGFALVSVGGMTAAALAIACLSLQGRAIGVLGRKTSGFGILVAALLLGAIAFVPIVGALLWVPVVAVQLLRADRQRTR